MAGLSMKVLLQLQKQQFDAGMRSVTSSIQGLGQTIRRVSGMLVGGLGLGALTSQFKDAARDMSVLKATMENVDNQNLKVYGENMQFIQRISKEYGQDMLSLGYGFAKFRAAAKQTNLSLEEQRFIFEALSKAAGAYHLSADQTSNVMLAVEQMLSKGKVTAEELRRQLGNSLPGAFQLMAKAAGVSTAELESLMRSGKLISEEVLPKFAQVLNTVTATANFESLQSSLNRFKNSWVQFVDNSGFENFFKGLVDFGTKGLNALGDKVHSFGGMVATVLGGVFGSQLPKIYRKLEEEGDKAIPTVAKHLEGTKYAAENAAKRVIALDKQIEKLKSGGTKGRVPIIIGREDLQYMEQLSKKEVDLLKMYTKRGQHLVYFENRMDAINHLTALRNDIEKRGVQALDEYIYTQNAMADGVKKYNAAWEGTKAILGSVWNTIKGIAISMAAAFAVSLIVSWISKIVEAAKEAKYFKNIIEETGKSIEAATAETEKQVRMAEELLKTAQNTAKSEEIRNNAAREFKRLLGDQKMSIDEIKKGSENVTTELNRWKNSLLEAAQSAAYFSKIQELTAQKIDLEMKRDAAMKLPQTYRPPIVGAGGGSLGKGAEVATQAARDVERYNKEIEQLNNSIDYFTKKAADLKLENPFVDPDFDKSDANAIKDILDVYSTSMEKLNKQLKDGSISTKKYNRDVNKLRESTLESVKKYKDWEDVVESLGTKYDKLGDEIQRTSNYTGKSDLTKLKEDLDDFKKDKNALDNTLKAGKMSGEEYAKALESLVKKYKDNIFGVDNLAQKLNTLGQKYKDIVNEYNQALQDVDLFNQIDEAIKANDKALENEMEKSLAKIEKYFEKSAQIMADGIPEKKKKEEGFFAYKDGLHESLGRYAKDSEDYAKQLENLKNKILELKKYSPLDPAMQKMFDEVIERLRVATNEATALRDAANFAEVRKDIQELSQQLASNVWETWADGLAGGASRIASAFESLNESFDGELFDEELFEKFDKLMQMISALNEVVETVNSTLQFFSTLLKTNAKYEEALAAATQITSGVKKKSLAAETVAEVTSAAATESSEAAKTAAIGATTKALAAQAVAGAASSVSWLPIVGPALAAVAIGAVVAAIMAGSKKFAKGGFVKGGPKSGDKTLIRANEGELVLNAGQQRNLWDILNGKGSLGGGEVTFKLRGTDLIGSIENTKSRRRG